MRSLSIKSLELINNELNVFLNNSFVVKLNTIGKINDIYKFKSKLKSPPIFVNESILYLNKKNQIIVVN